MNFSNRTASRPTPKQGLHHHGTSKIHVDCLLLSCVPADGGQNPTWGETLFFQLSNETDVLVTVGGLVAPDWDSLPLFTHVKNTVVSIFTNRVTANTSNCPRHMPAVSFLVACSALHLLQHSSLGALLLDAGLPAKW